MLSHIKLAVIAATIMALAAGSMLSPVSHAAPVPPQEKAVGGGGRTVSQGTGNSPARVAGRPVAELLNPDGTLNLGTGFNGTLDLAGWQPTASRPGAAAPGQPSAAA